MRRQFPTLGREAGWGFPTQSRRGEKGIRLMLVLSPNDTFQVTGTLRSNTSLKKEDFGIPVYKTFLY